MDHTVKSETALQDPSGHPLAEDYLDLNLLDFPLNKHALIEASAGTGKTYALANLYLRYLLERGLDVSQILVVTFTEAATQELKDRIRLRIKELLAVFEIEAEAERESIGGSEPPSSTSDPILMALYQSAESKVDAKIVLKIAERNIDQAQVFTIHGFCQQVLSKYALEIGFPVKQNLLEDETEVLVSLTEDFWRREVLTLDDALILELSQLWAGPLDLLNNIKPMLARQPERIHPELSELSIDGWCKVVDDNAEWYLSLQQEIKAVYDDVALLIEASDLKRLKDKLKWWQAIGEWCEEANPSSLPSSGSRKNLLKDFTPDILTAQTKAKGKVPEHKIFERFEEKLLSPPIPIKEAFIAVSAKLLQKDLVQHKLQAGLVSFDDLIYKLSEAFGADEGISNESGISSFEQSGDKLARILSARYKLGLIDEFQDTDKHQYQIFKRIFLHEEPSLERQELQNNLVLIGDPKQAIYGFRGGDITTYLQAKSDMQANAAGQIYTMKTNWRSSPAMVEAANHIFSQIPHPFISKEIPFIPVLAASKGDTAEPGTEPVPAMQVTCLDHDKANKETITRTLASICVRQVIELLNEPQVENHDIAILVRSASEAELIKQSLSYNGLSASYEGKSSVYDGDEALSLLYLLRAVENPSNELLIRQCLSSLFFAKSDQELEQLYVEDEILLEYLSLFRHFEEIWIKHGVLAMIRKALSDLEVFDHWRTNLQLGASGWERSLSNVNQLAEILQEKSKQLKTHSSLIAWYEQELQSEFSHEASKVRLESDERLIRIVTIHKSKGLEYPYVFLPFIFHSRAANEFWFYDSAGRLNLDLLSQDKYSSNVELERMAEDLRLFYVALTRAKYRTYLGTAYYKGSRQSLGVFNTAFGRLISQNRDPKNLDENALNELLQSLSDSSLGRVSVRSITIDEAIEEPQAMDARLEQNTLAKNLDLSARKISRRLVHSNKTQSFTGLLKEHERLSSEHLNDQFIDHDYGAVSTQGEGFDIFNFPKGSNAGTFLHSLFEEISLTSGLPLTMVNEMIEDNNSDVEFLEQSKVQWIKDKLRQTHVVDSNLDGWAEYLSVWIERVRCSVLYSSFSLSLLSENEYVPELEFYFSVAELSKERLNKLLNQHGYPPIAFETFQGYLKGAIDLTFVDQGRYYIVDYKSNYLGDTIEAYSQDAMHEAIGDHRYDIQYLIYTLAIHRFLKHRMGSRYNYESDFGGAIYLFLRGLQLSSENLLKAEEINSRDANTLSGIYRIKPAQSLIEALDNLVGLHGN